MTATHNPDSGSRNAQADGDAKHGGQPGRSAPAVFTVPEFCSAHRISRALFYILAGDGRGPRVMKAGRRTLISLEAAAEWRRRMETPAEAES